MKFKKGQKVRVKKSHYPHGVKAGAIGKVVGFHPDYGVHVEVPCTRYITFLDYEIAPIKKRKKKRA